MSGGRVASRPSERGSPSAGLYPTGRPRTWRPVTCLRVERNSGWCFCGDLATRGEIKGTYFGNHVVAVFLSEISWWLLEFGFGTRFGCSREGAEFGGLPLMVVLCVEQRSRWAAQLLITMGNIFESKNCSQNGSYDQN